jgi:dihydrofolate reductase
VVALVPGGWVVQAPGESDEDKTGGFEHGGWHMPYFDDVSRVWAVENLNAAGGFLLGRRTYESFAGHWPQASEHEKVIARPLNTQPKYVASRTLTEPLAWQNSTVLQGDTRQGHHQGLRRTRSCDICALEDA